MAQDSVPAPRSRRQHSVARRQQILDAALTLFARHGFAATSTKRIAQEVGVTEGLIFHYFGSKSELLRELTRQRRTFMGEVRAILTEADGRPAREVLRTIVLGWVEAIQRQGDLVTMLLVESQSNAELNEAFRGVIEETVGAMEAYLTARVAAGELRRDLPTRTSAMMFFSSLMMFFLAHRHLEGDAWRRQASAFTQEMLDTWFAGALPPGATPTNTT